MEIFTDNCKLPSSEHTRDELSIVSIEMNWTGEGEGVEVALIIASNSQNRGPGILIAIGGLAEG